MKYIQIECLGRTLRAWSTMAIVLGLVFGLCASGSWAQNAAQQKALARLRPTHTSVRSLDTLPGSNEAANATLNQPSGLAFDSAGDIFIADSANNLILEVDLKGIISTVAGTGEQGFGGDGGAATSALLDTPIGVAIDAAGNIYIADTHNNRIRRVSAGMITTIAGSGVAGFSGDGAAATAAALDLPTAIAIDTNSNIYIADTENHRIRKITGTTISTVAGNGEQVYSGDGGLATAAGLDSPNGIAVDAAFNLYIGDTHNQRVRMVTYSTSIISTLAGTGIKGFNADGTATTSELARPRGVAVGTSGTVYVADSDNQRIRTVGGGILTTIAGNGEEGYSGDTGVATDASLNTPRDIAVYGSTVAVADTDNRAIRTVVSNGVTTTAGTSTQQAESLLINGATTVVYGTGTLTASFSNGSNTATGLVTFYDGLGVSTTVGGTAQLSANTAILDTSQLDAGTHYIIASYAGDSNNQAITSSTYVLVVTQASTTTKLQSSNLTPDYGVSVTLTATVASTTSGIPTGTVYFYDGSTLLNTAPANLSGGIASLTLSTLAAGVQSITAHYNGATNFSTSISSEVTETVMNTDFTIAATPTTQSVLPSHSVSYTITLTPAGATFSNAVSLSVSGLPTGVTASFTPASINAGAGASTSVLTLNASAQARMEKSKAPWEGMSTSIALALLLLPMTFSRRVRRFTQRHTSTSGWAIVFFALAAASILSGCSGGYFSHDSQSHTVTVTATSGTITHTTNVTLIVQ